MSQFIKTLKYHRLFFITLGDEKSSEAKRRVNASVTSVTNVSDVLKIC